MKKVLLLIISLFIVQVTVQVAVQAYQTVLVDFPQNQEWHATYYQTQGSETILQYVPYGQTGKSWSRTLIFHSYKEPEDSAATFLDKTTSQMENLNSSQAYRYTKYTPVDSIATRCVRTNARMTSQCDIFRVSKSFEGLISMQYINKNIQDFKGSYNLWYGIVRDIRIYQSYYREDRVMDKATSFEL